VEDVLGYAGRHVVVTGAPHQGWTPPPRPIRRRSTPEEQASPPIFLNSPRSSYVDGESLVTNGGFYGAVQSGQLDLTKMVDAPGATGS
jgi:hypothetical protein